MGTFWVLAKAEVTWTERMIAHLVTNDDVPIRNPRCHKGSVRRCDSRPEQRDRFFPGRLFLLQLHALVHRFGILAPIENNENAGIEL